MRKMKWVPFQQPPKDPGFPTFVFKSTDGFEYRTRIEQLTGEPERSVSNQLLMDKFDDLAAPVIFVRSWGRVKDMVFDLGNIDSVRMPGKELMGL